MVGVEGGKGRGKEEMGMGWGGGRIRGRWGEKGEGKEVDIPGSCTPC